MQLIRSLTVTITKKHSVVILFLNSISKLLIPTQHNCELYM